MTTPPRSANPGDRRRDWDQFSKTAVRAGIAGVLAQAGIEVSADALVLESVDLPAGTHRADLLFSGPDGVVVHIEIQQRPDPFMGVRMLEYAVRIVRSPQLTGRVREIHQVVIQLSGVPMPTRHDFGAAVGHFHLVHTPTTPLSVLLQTPALAPFGLTSGDPAAVGPVIDRIAAVSNADLRASLATLALFLAPGLRVTLMERMRRTALIDTRDDMLAEVRGTWLGHDLITEGLSQGLSQGQLIAIVDVLTARFPDADPMRIHRTATRLLALDDDHPVRLALALDALDS